MQDSNPPGVRASAKRAIGIMTVAGLAGLVAAPVAHAAENSVSEVLVTGKNMRISPKITAPLLDTPKSVSVITSDTLRDAGILSLADAFRTLPGITLESGEGGNPIGDRPRIRGIESTGDIFVDGIRDAGAQSRDVFALEQIEVIKGPGSAFTGRGSTGGSVNIVTKSARATNSARAGVAVGTDDTRRVTADVNRVITDGVALRVNALYTENGVAGRNFVEGSRWGVAPSVAIGLGSDTQATLDYYHLDSEELPDLGIPFYRYTVNGVVRGHPLAGYEDEFYGLANRDFRDNKTDIATLRLQHRFGEQFQLTNATRAGRTTNAYVVTNPDDSKGNVANGYLVRITKNRNTETETLANTTNFSGELSLGGLQHSFLTGVEISREQTRSQGYVVAGPGLTAGAGLPVVTGTAACNAGNVGAPSGYNCTLLRGANAHDPWVGTVTRSPTVVETEVKTLAVYLFDTIDFSDRWSLNLGLRYDDYENEVTALVPLSNASAFWNYQAGLVYKPTINSSVYVSYGTSSNPSGEGVGDSSGLALTTQNLDPEENTSYEVGAKWNVGRLNITTAFFRTEKTNARVTDATGVISLIGDQRVDGFELGLSGNITPRWTVFGGYTYQDGVVVDAGFVAGLPSPNNGNAFPNTPRNSVSLWTTFALNDAFSVGGGLSSMSSRFANVANTYTVPGYVRLDLSATWRVTPKFDVQLNLKNITDERYAERVYTTHMVQVAAGASALISTNYRF